jgi:hypothetical protein
MSTNKNDAEALDRRMREKVIFRLDLSYNVVVVDSKLITIGSTVNVPICHTAEANVSYDVVICCYCVVITYNVVICCYL